MRGELDAVCRQRASGSREIHGLRDLKFAVELLKFSKSFSRSYPTWGAVVTRAAPPQGRLQPNFLVTRLWVGRADALIILTLLYHWVKRVGANVVLRRYGFRTPLSQLNGIYITGLLTIQTSRPRWS